MHAFRFCVVLADTSTEEAEAMGAAGLVVFLLLLALGLAAYFAPTAIALFRGHSNLAPIIIVNLFLGWSLIGWVIAIAWSLSAQEKRVTVRYSRE